MNIEIASQSELTDEESFMLAVDYQLWQHLRSHKDYEYADRVRYGLMQAGVDVNDGSWHAVFESPDCREARLNKRNS